MVYIRPAREGLLVRCPETRLHLAPEGRWVDLSPTGPFATYWLRQVNDGSVVVGEPPKDDAAAS